MAGAASFVLLASIYGLATPMWEAPDEPAHYSFIVHLVTTGTLPVNKEESSHAHHPPLYYALASLPLHLLAPNELGHTFRPNPDFIWLEQGGQDPNWGLHGSRETFPFAGDALALHLARFVSVLMGAGTVLLTAAIGWQLFPERRLVGSVAAGLVGLTPQFLFISGSVNNDNLLTLAATGALWQVLRSMKDPESATQWALAGGWVSAAILAKVTGPPAAVVVALALLGCAIHHRSLRLLARGGTAFAAVTLLATGWWFIRSFLLYGDPLSVGGYENVRDTPVDWDVLAGLIQTQAYSFWAMFGWMNVAPPEWLYAPAEAIGLLGVAGLVVVLARRRSTLTAYQQTGLAVLGLAVLLQELYMVGVVTRCDASCYQGRYLFPVIAPLMLLLAVGMVLLTERLALLMVGAAAGVLVATAAYVPFGVILPAYPMVPLPKWSLWAMPHQTSYAFGDVLKLRGYGVEAGNGWLGSTLYWEAVSEPDFDYSVFVHLVDDAGDIVSQEDHAPGLGLDYPPTRWLEGDIVADEHLLDAPLQGPGEYHLRVGVYNWRSGERLSATNEGAPVGDFVVLEGALRR